MSAMQDGAAAGDGAPTGVRLAIPVRWGDMDAIGHVNNTTFFQYCESGRIAYFEALGLDALKRRPTDGPGLVAASLSFRRQVKYPATVDVEVHATKIGGRSFTLAYALRDAATGEVAADGESVCVWVDYAEGRAMPLPDALIDRIVAIERDERLRARPKTA